MVVYQFGRSISGPSSSIKKSIRPPTAHVSQHGTEARSLWALDIFGMRYTPLQLNMAILLLAAETG